jgi:hypothetical protein
VLERGGRLGGVSAPELARLDQRHHQPGEGIRRGIVTDRALGLSALQDATDCLRRVPNAAVKSLTDPGLVLDSVGIGEQDAEHRCGVHVVEVIGGKEVPQPVVEARALLGQIAQVAGGIPGNSIESSGKELGFGAEVLKDHRLSHPDARGDVGHASLVVADAGKQGDGRIEDRLAPRGGIQTFSAGSLASAGRGMLRQRAHNIDPGATKFIGLFLAAGLAKTKFSLD